MSQSTNRNDKGSTFSIIIYIIYFFQCLEILGKAFGTTENSKGFKMLPPCIKIIQGDGISYKTLGMYREFCGVYIFTVISIKSLLNNFHTRIVCLDDNLYFVYTVCQMWCV